MASTLQRYVGRYLRLPADVSVIEQRYLRRMNKFALFVALSHAPGLVVLALLAGTSPWEALALSTGEAVLIASSYVLLRAKPRAMSVVYGVNAALLGALVLYVGRGAMQDELRMYFYVAMALMISFANPTVIIAMLAGMLVHTIAFSPEVSAAMAAVYMWFALVEAAAGCVIARGFFESVVLLERKVAARTTDLKARGEATARILDNVAQGLVTTDLEGRISSECSRQLLAWFGPIDDKVRVWDYIAAHDTSLSAWIELSIGSLRDNVLPVEVVLGQLPSRLDRDGRNFRAEYVPIGAPASGVLVVISDITDEVARAIYEEQQRELIDVVERASSDRTGFVTFLADGAKLVRESGEATAADLPAFKRAVHTLKGNASLFGIDSIARLCHELEDYVDTEIALPAETERARLAATWTAFHDRARRVLGLSERRTLIVDWNDYQAVLASIPSPEPAWVSRIRHWSFDATRPYLERFAEQAQQLAQRLEKPIPTIDVFDHDLFVVPERFAPVWSAFAHAVRNAVDHGLESADARIARGKSAAGHLTLRTDLVAGDLEISIGDDGAGIDWERVAARARACGLPAETHDDLVAAVFADGVSTATAVTEVSGRGVGMSALKYACTELGGRVDIRSERGRGTTITCRVPTGDAIAERARDLTRRRSSTYGRMMQEPASPH